MVKAGRWAFGLVAALVALSAPAQIWNPPIHVVNVSCCAFSDPANGGSNVTIIPVNTIVKWVKTDAMDYTVTSGTGLTDSAAGPLFDGSLVAPATIYTRLFDTVGTYPYFCSLHPAMTGLMHVLPQAIGGTTISGCLGSTGAELTLANGSLPFVGNAAFSLFVAGALPGAQCWLFMAGSLTGSSLTVWPGCDALLDLASLALYMQAGLTPTGPHAANAGGVATFAFPIPADPALGGLTVAAQGLAFDAGAPLGIVLTNGVFLIVGA